ncbi:MAG: prepilin-type N-terminal cleavage/methylation domain-containing protein [Acidobacteria bacterium]|nr:prepilin-type N-terminal cleavage/methylation domain-containing protein [Acidobacteriota bacterium]
MCANNKKMRGNAEKGFSLIELLFAMTIFLIVTAAIFGVLQMAQKNRDTLNQLIPINKSIQISLNLLGRDTYNTGFGYPKISGSVPRPTDGRVEILLGLPTSLGSNGIVPIIDGNALHSSSINPDSSVLTDQVTMIHGDAKFNTCVDGRLPLAAKCSDPDEANKPIISIPISGRATRSGSTVTVTFPEAVSHKFRRNDLIMLSGDIANRMAVVTAITGPNTIQITNGDPLNINLASHMAILHNVDVSVHRVFMQTYFVTPEGNLTRRSYGNDETLTSVGYKDNEIAYNVSDFQVEYILSDQTKVDHLRNASNVPGARAADVRQIKFTINVIGNDSGQALTATTTMSANYSTRNLGFEEL